MQQWLMWHGKRYKNLRWDSLIVAEVAGVNDSRVIRRWGSKSVLDGTVTAKQSSQLSKQFTDSKNASNSDKGNEELSSEEHDKSYISGQTDTESNGNSKWSKLHHVNGYWSIAHLIHASTLFEKCRVLSGSGVVDCQRQRLIGNYWWRCIRN